MIMCASMVSASSPVALFRWLIFVHPAYQSGLLTGPLLLFRFLLSLIHFPQFFRTFTTLFILFTSWGMALVLSWFEPLPHPDPAFRSAKAFIDAERNDLARFELPYIGPVAERWLSEE